MRNTLWNKIIIIGFIGLILFLASIQREDPQTLTAAISYDSASSHDSITQNNIKIDEERQENKNAAVIREHLEDAPSNNEWDFPKPTQPLNKETFTKSQQIMEELEKAGKPYLNENGCLESMKDAPPLLDAVEKEAMKYVDTGDIIYLNKQETGIAIIFSNGYRCVYGYFIEGCK